MKPFLLPKWLFDHQLLNAQEAQVMEEQYAKLPPNLFVELNLLLYGGILAFLSGLGAIVYLHIDKTGHLLLIGLLLAVSAFGYRFSLKRYGKWQPFKVSPPGATEPYVLLLSFLLLGAAKAYLQYQFGMLGNDNTLAALLIGLAGVATAYRFDDERILSLGLAGVASACGIKIFSLSGLAETQLWLTGLAVGVLFLILGYAMAKQGIKAHFETVYANLSAWLIVLSNLFLIFDAEPGVVYVLLIIACLVLFGFFIYSKNLQSVPLYCLVVVGTAITLGTGLVKIPVFSEIVLVLGLYFVLGAIVVTAYFIIKHKKYLKS
jgi:hypothetical protein